MSRKVNRRRVDRVPGDGRRRLARLLRLAAPSLVLLAALGGGGVLAFRLATGPRLAIQEIRFHGLGRVSPAELQALLPVKPGERLWAVDTAMAEAALLRHPWISAARVRRRLPPALEVTVEERRAAALVDLGELYLVDAGGEVFKRAAPGDGLDLPVITGIDREAWLSRRAEAAPLLDEALALATRWSDGRLDGPAPLSEIHVDPDYGAAVVTAEGTEIRLGQRDLEIKLLRLARLLPALAAEGRKPEVIHLDNRRHPEWVTVRFAGER